MRNLLLIVTFAIALAISLFTKSYFLQQPVLAINYLQNIRDTWQIYQTYIPPDRGAPERTTTTGTRGQSLSVSQSLSVGQCLLLNQKLTLLLPDTGAGLTISKYPTFYVYIPPYEKAKEAVFFLVDAYDNQIYEGIFQLAKKTGIIQLKLPAKQLTTLQVGKIYNWGLQIFCNPKSGDKSGDPIINGLIELIKP